jgi:hypothetical protein
LHKRITSQPFELVGHTTVLIGIKLAALFPLALAFGYSRADAVRMGHTVAALLQASGIPFVA